MPKTGGLSVKRVLGVLDPNYREIKDFPLHSPLSRVNPARYEGRILFGACRDPWSQYISLYQHTYMNFPELIRAWGAGDESFKAVLRRWTHPQEATGIGKEWCPQMPLVPDSEIASLQQSGAGLHTWVFNYVYGEPSLVRIFIPTLRLAEGLAKLLNVPQSMVDAIPRENQSAGRYRGFVDPRAEYDKEMLDWVAEADSKIIERFGYEPFRAPAPGNHTGLLVL